MATIVELPRLSDTMEEGVIAKWHVAEGDKVKRGQVIAEIETDKATMEFESFDAGTVLKLVAPEGETLPLGAPIAVLGKPGENAEDALSKRGGGEAKAKATDEGANRPEAKTDREEGSTRGDVKGTPEGVRRTEPEPHVNGEVVDGPAREARRVPASPIARRLAREYGLELTDIQGSGPHGRVVKTDVESAAQAQEQAPAAARGVQQETFGARGDTEVKLSQMRKTIAKRMAQANSEIPHFYLTVAVDMDQAVKLRQDLKAALPDEKVSFNDIVAFAAVKALMAHPEVNAYWNGSTIVRRGDVHLGIAVAVEEGLLVPVVRNADRKSLRQVATEIRELGTRARDRKLEPAQLSGSTFTVSNLGMFGIESFSAVVNPGEGAILAVGAIADEVVVKSGQVATAKRMRASLSCDHRVMDGATGAQFLATFRSLLEQPLTMLT